MHLQTCTMHSAVVRMFILGIKRGCRWKDLVSGTDRTFA